MKWLTVASVQVGQVVANTQPADWYHWPDDGRTGQPLPRPGHHHLYLRCDGQGAVPWAVHRLLQQATWRHAALELRRFPARVHDRVPCVVWRVDRVHVGMSRRLRAHLHPVLPPHHDHRKSRRTCLLTHCARLSVMLWGASRVVGVVSILHTLPMLNRPCWQHWWCQSSVLSIGPDTATLQTRHFLSGIWCDDYSECRHGRCHRGRIISLCNHGPF